jgi:hypothetical protein
LAGSSDVHKKCPFRLAIVLFVNDWRPADASGFPLKKRACSPHLTPAPDCPAVPMANRRKGIAVLAPDTSLTPEKGRVNTQKMHADDSLCQKISAVLEKMSLGVME